MTFKNIIAKLIFVLLILFISNISIGQVTTTASCCSSKKGRCTGSAYCNVCTNCSRCGYCNSGRGFCGVCNGRKPNRTNNSSSRKTNKSYNRSGYNSSSRTYEYSTSPTTESNNKKWESLPDDSYSEYYMKTLVVTAEILNLRKGTNTSYEIIQKLTKNQELLFLAITGEWVKVKVKSNGTIGFVHYKYVAVIN